MSVANANTLIDYDISLNQWYMATITVEGNFIEYFLDGCKIGEAYYASTSNSGNGHPTVPLGTSRIFDRYFDGKIDDISIYSRALNPKEVLELYTSGIPCNSATSISTSTILPKINIYPNPSYGSFYVETEKNNQLAAFQLYDASGREVASLAGIHSQKIQIDLEDFPVGLYILKVMDQSKRTSVHKLILR